MFIRHTKCILSTLSLCLFLSACAPTAQTWFKQSQTSYQRQNFGSAFIQAESAANLGNVKAQYALGYMYYYGIGTTANALLARVYINKAAQRGYAPAQQAIDNLYGKRPSHIPKPH